jgi:electron transfer flavoprotein alpha subunit
MVAVVVCREGRLPAGADEAVSEAGGAAIVVGTGASAAASSLVSAGEVRWASVSGGPAALAAALAPVVSEVEVIVLPASPDGRDLAPRLAFVTARPLVAGAVAVGPDGASVLRADGRVLVDVAFDGPVVATLMPGSRSPIRGDQPSLVPITLDPPGSAPEPELLGLIPPDPATMDLADATRVLGGGAGLVPAGTSDERARSIFALLAGVASALGASAGATRVVTDAGWMPYDRQIGTTGVAIDPDLYVAIGVSGASQHIGGLGAPRHMVSVNTDSSCPMTSLADLGLVADGPGVLIELARRLGVTVPVELEEVPV